MAEKKATRSSKKREALRLFSFSSNVLLHHTIPHHKKQLIQSNMASSSQQPKFVVTYVSLLLSRDIQSSIDQSLSLCHLLVLCRSCSLPTETGGTRNSVALKKLSSVAGRVPKSWETAITIIPSRSLCRPRCPTAAAVRRSGKAVSKTCFASTVPSERRPWTKSPCEHRS